MKNEALIIGIILLFIGVSVVSGFNSNSTDISQPMIRGWLYVGGSGPGNYTTIQAAINASSDGDTVFVYDDSSPYYGSIIVDKSIKVQGENMTTTIIEDHGFSIVSDFVTITGFTIQNGDTGIAIEHFSNAIIENCVFHHLSWGAQLLDSENNSIRNCSFYLNDFFGVQLSGYQMDNNEISYCDFFDNKGIDMLLYDGAIFLECYHSRGIKIHHCNITNNSHYGILLYLTRFVEISYNNIINNQNHMGLEISGFSFCGLQNNWWGTLQGPNITIYRPLNWKNPLTIRKIDDSDTVFFYGWRTFLTGITRILPWLSEPVTNAGQHT